MVKTHSDLLEEILILELMHSETAHRADANAIAMGSVLKGLLDLLRCTVAQSIDEVVTNGGNDWCCSQGSLMILTGISSLPFQMQQPVYDSGI